MVHRFMRCDIDIAFFSIHLRLVHILSWIFALHFAHRILYGLIKTALFCEYNNAQIRYIPL